MLVGFKASNHPQQTRYLGSNPDVDDRAMTREDFSKLNDRFHFSVDVAASTENAKCEQFITIAENGLGKSWAGHFVEAEASAGTCSSKYGLCE